jgi:FAD:protein FMN transferase
VTTATVEERLAFPCFGGRVTLVATGHRDLYPVRARLEHWHRTLTRFDPGSELSRLNADPAERVVVSPVMALFVAAAVEAAQRTDGLVDPTLAGEIERAGYTGDLDAPVDLATSLRLAPPRRPARPHRERRWVGLSVDPLTRTVSRPPGLELDSGGIAKGMLADMAARLLSGAGSYAVDCCGDVRIGGRDRRDRPVLVDDPFGRGTLQEFAVADGGVATSGIGRRSWIGSDARPAHHLLDPATGRPAYTGVVQATALAPTAADAEVRAKAALLSGGDQARQWLRHGGVLVFDDGSHALFGES